MRRFTIKHPRLVMIGVNLFSGILVAILLMVCLAYNLSWLCFLFMLLMVLVFTYLPLAVGRWVDEVIHIDKLLDNIVAVDNKAFIDYLSKTYGKDHIVELDPTDKNACVKRTK